MPNSALARSRYALHAMRMLSVPPLVVVPAPPSSIADAGSGALNSDKHIETTSASILRTPASETTVHAISRCAARANENRRKGARTGEDVCVQRVRHLEAAKRLAPDVAHVLAAVVHRPADASALPLCPRQVAELGERGRHVVRGEARLGQGGEGRRVGVLGRELRRAIESQVSTFVAIPARTPSATPVYACRSIRCAGRRPSGAKWGRGRGWTNLSCKVERDLVELALDLVADGRKEEHAGEALAHEDEVGLASGGDQAASPQVSDDADELAQDEVPVRSREVSTDKALGEASMRTRTRPVARVSVFISPEPKDGRGEGNAHRFGRLNGHVLLAKHAG